MVAATLSSMPDYRFVPVLEGSLAHLYRVGRGANLDGWILIVRPQSTQGTELAVEVRIGSLGNSADSEALVNEVVERLGQVATEGAPSKASSGAPNRPGSVLHSVGTVSGRWIDLDAAVSAARMSPKTVDAAVLSVDRWRFATIYSLRTLDEQPATLVIVGDVFSDGGPRAAMMRIGHFDGRPADEKAFLKRLSAELTKLSREPRWPGSR
jgi:hypothetical protein